ncbi:sodium channel protein Nach [Ochlerotatus camptorhynchus]|uniref:sodium channel protein Nach n=1 Tax=Ochlerotatus camptorhynchus TaxID=644619 RepID=UPI0031DC95CC
MTLILLYTLESFDETVNINIETSYLRWNNTFPATSICYTKGRSLKSIGKFLEDHWANRNLTKPVKFSSFLRLAQNYLFVSPSNSIDDRGMICSGMNETCNLDLETMQKLFFPQSCSEIFVDVIFLGKVYRCEDIFKLFHTEMGPCYVANSIYSYKMDYDKLPLKYTIENAKRAFEFRYKEIEAINFVLFIHSPEELPYSLMPPFRLRKYGAFMHYSLNTIEVYNHPDVKAETIGQRECRFPYENITVNLPYSFTNCFLYKRIQMELAQCNCTIPTSPNEFKPKYCNFTGLGCISRANILTGAKETLFDGNQPCIQSCLEMEINVLGENTFNTEDPNAPGHVLLEIMNIPTSRYERSVSRTNLDFIVSLGGVGGLFFGVSLLSIVEIFYFWLRRCQ